MGTFLGTSYPPTWRGKPQQMLSTDHPLWDKFLDDYGGLFERFYYNVLLGEAALTYDKPPTWEQKLERSVLSKKIDVIGETKDEVWIIEVASRPGLRAVGQIMSYRALWFEDPKINKIERFVLVTDQIDRDLLTAAATYGIETIILRPS
jgi:hypothetical protein